MYYVGTIPYKSETKPYINTSDRVMVPVRTLSNAFGIDDKDISWVEDDTFRGVVIQYAARTIKIPAMSLSLIHILHLFSRSLKSLKISF